MISASSVADDWIAAMGNLCGISEAIQDAAAKRSTKKLQAAEAEAAEPDMYVVIKDSHSGSTSDLDINGQDDVALLKRKAAPKVSSRTSVVRYCVVLVVVLA